MKKLFWIDLEMTGLDENVHTIIEAAVVVTDLNLNILEELNQVVFQPPEVLAKMDDWCKKTHGDSGLTALIPQGTPLEEAEKTILAFIDRHFDSREKIVLSGNSVSNDKRFVDRYWPKLAKRLHYRIIDVSSFKEIFRDKYGLQFQKRNTHRAVEDIHESIRELGFYLSHVHPTATEASPKGI